MKRLLYLQNDDTSALLNQLNEGLETKNRLLKLIIMNPDKKSDVLERRKNQSRYEEQIFLLESLKGMVISCTSREDIQRINDMIDYYKSIE